MKKYQIIFTFLIICLLGINVSKAQNCFKINEIKFNNAKIFDVEIDSMKNIVVNGKFIDTFRYQNLELVPIKENDQFDVDDYINLFAIKFDTLGNLLDYNFAKIRLFGKFGKKAQINIYKIDKVNLKTLDIYLNLRDFYSNDTFLIETKKDTIKFKKSEVNQFVKIGNKSKNWLNSLYVSYPSCSGAFGMSEIFDFDKNNNIIGSGYCSNNGNSFLIYALFDGESGVFIKHFGNSISKKYILASSGSLFIFNNDIVEKQIRAFKTTYGGFSPESYKIYEIGEYIYLFLQAKTAIFDVIGRNGLVDFNVDGNGNQMIVCKYKKDDLTYIKGAYTNSHEKWNGSSLFDLLPINNKVTFEDNRFGILVPKNKYVYNFHYNNNYFELFYPTMIDIDTNLELKFINQTSANYIFDKFSLEILDSSTINMNLRHKPTQIYYTYNYFDFPKDKYTYLFTFKNNITRQDSLFWYIDGNFSNNDSIKYKFKQSAIYPIKLFSISNIDKCLNDTIKFNLNVDYNNVNVKDISEIGIKTYPNPFNNEIKIEGLSDRLTNIKVVNTLGQVIWQNTQSKNILNLEFLSPGNYVLIFEIDDKIYKSKVVKVN